MAKNKYQIITTQNWAHMELFAESIPHLFHWDLCYLWMLEKRAKGSDSLIPPIWEERLKAFGHLLGLLLMGKVVVEEEPIGAPMLQYVQPFGVHSVYWIKDPEEGRRIGVLSPTVLVRPLPDFELEDVRDWPQHPGVTNPDELYHFRYLAVQTLSQGAAEGSFRHRLARVIAAMGTEEMRSGPPGDPLLIPIMEELRWTQQKQDGTSVSVVQRPLLVRRHGRRVFIPRCDSCGEPLLYAREYEIPILQGQQVSLQCNSRACQGQNYTELNLANFLIWHREGTDEVVLWDWERSQQMTEPKQGYPPGPEIAGQRVQFQWNPAQLGGPTDTRFLTFRFPDQNLRTVTLDHVLYQTVLVPGDLTAFDGLPLRYEWRDALVKPSNNQTEDALRIDARSSGDGAKVTYSDLRLHGWPESLTIRYPGMFVKYVPELAAGIYPNAGRLPASWQWFRVFLDGLEHAAYRLRTPESKQLLPGLCEVEDAYPEAFSIEDISATDVGVTYGLQRPEPDVRVGERTVYVGVDLGTTNTIVYAMKEGGGGSLPRPEDHGIKPASLCAEGRQIQWFCGVPGWLNEAWQVGGFLPGPRYGDTGDPRIERDPYLTPSELWVKGATRLIRWGPETPVEGAKPVTNFKLDRGSPSAQQAREAFLREFLLLMMPAILDAETQVSNVSVDIGMAFPMGLDSGERKTMSDLIDQTKETLHRLCQCTFNFYTISEARACVKAFGTPEPGETFLIADMGGGTMDVALFTIGEELPHQIGSIQFAGEVFVKASARRASQGVWDIRDNIRSGDSRGKFGKNQEIRSALWQFTTLAYEFLRVMTAAFLKLKENSEKKIKVVLVGNGWHIVEAFNQEANRRGPRRVFEEHYGDLTRLIEVAGVSLDRNGLLRKLPSSKHLVVIGAMENASSDTPKKKLDPDGEPELSRLPVGRDLDIHLNGKIHHFAWHDLLGESLTVPGFSYKNLRASQIDIDLHDIPSLSPSWESHLLEQFDVETKAEVPYPEKMRFRSQLQQGATGQAAVRLTKGPLQIILENHWKDWLLEGR